MNQEQAVNILLQVARAAQKAGVLTLEEAVVVAEAVSVFSPKQEESVNEAAQEVEAPKAKGKK